MIMRFVVVIKMAFYIMVLAKKLLKLKIIKQTLSNITVSRKIMTEFFMPMTRITRK